MSFYLNKFLWSNKPINRFATKRVFEKINIIEKITILSKPINIIEKTYNKTQEQEDDITQEEDIIDDYQKYNNIEKNDKQDEMTNKQNLKQIILKNTEYLKGVKNLEELECYMRNSSLPSDNEKKFGFGEGVANCEIFVIRECPAFNSELKPFCEKGENLLKNMLKFVLKDLENVFLSYNIFWSPENQKSPSGSEINFSKPFLEKQIDLIKPKILLLFGGVSVKNILGKKDGVLSIRGNLFHVEIMGNKYPVVTTFHPDFLLRAPGYKVQAKEDMLFFKNILETLNINI
jgi:uracil-DNA glycosylase family 4